MPKPSAEIELSPDQVRTLLRAQHPRFADLPITAGPSGWDNDIFRLGDALAVRVPTRAAAAELIEHEQRWLPLLEPRLPLRIPTPVAQGVPQDFFPWCWSITPWIEGRTLDQCPPDPSFVVALADFVVALHVPAPADAPFNPWRVHPLLQRQDKFDAAVADLADRGCVLDARHVRIWEEAANAPLDITPTWIHGDLHARNALVSAGALCAVIDWGDMSRGDRAVDLAAGWMVLPDLPCREQWLQRCHASAPTWRRARGWALLYAMNVLRSEDPAHRLSGSQTLARLLEGP